MLLVLILLATSGCNMDSYKEGSKDINPYVEGWFTYIDNANAEYYFGSQTNDFIIDEVVEYNKNIIEFLSIKEKNIFVCNRRFIL